MKDKQDGLENLPPDGDWMNAFPDERLTECVVIDHKTVSAPPPPLIHLRRPETSTERALILLRRHAMATSLVALTVMAAPVAIVIGARAREGRDARPVVADVLPQSEPSTLEVSADRHSLGVGGPSADTLNLSGIPAREKKAVTPPTTTPKPPSRPTATPRPVPATTKSSTRVPTPSPAPPPAPAPMAVSTPTMISAPPPTPTPTPAATPTPVPSSIAAPVSPSTSTSASRAESASVLSAAPPAPTGREVETAVIKQVLDRYRQAFDTLSVGPVEAYWPSINAKVLTRAFSQLESQTVTFDACDFDINRDQAAATCSGRAKFTTKVGSRTPHVESRRWTFRLARMSDRWVILSVESR